jgi:hyperosmotically inducible protein
MKGDAGAESNAGISARPWFNGLAIVAVAALVSGCAVAMLGGAARSGGGSTGTSGSAPASKPAGSQAARPTSSVAADNSISTAVRSRFAASTALKPLKLTVDTYDGVVTLRGQVNNVEQRNAAQLEARAVSGVKSVKNELTVR